MKFTYDGYRNLLEKIRSKGYQTTDYKNWKKSDRCVILRHDIDNDIDKAVRLSELERIGGVNSTYFVLLSSDFYNVFSKKSNDGLRQILANGHTIGLHFDEVRYPELSGDIEAVKEKIMEEAEILSRAVGSKIDTVSMHRPSRAVLDADLKIPGIINSYGRTYFKEFKYLSDSRRRWREPVEEIVESGEYKRLHILTHAFWYNETEEDIRKSISKFINHGNSQRYQTMKANITDLSSIMAEDEVIREDAGI